MTKDDAKQYDGQWVIDEVFDRPVGGFVRLGDEILLTLYATDMSAEERGKVSSSGRVRAIGDCGRPITLLEGYNRPDAPYGRIEFEFSTALVGHGIAEEIQTTFDTCAIRFDHVNRWASRRTIEILPYDEETQKSGILYGDPETLTAEVQGGTVSLGMLRSIASGHHLFSVSAYEYFMVTTPEPLSLDSLIRDWVTPLRYFVSLATGVLPAIRELNLGSNPSVKVFSRYNEGAELSPETIPRQSMLLSLADIEFDVDMPKWFEIVKNYEGACDLIFNRGRISQSLTSQFFDIASAAEAVHRKLLPRTVRQTQEEKDRVERILSGIIEESDRQWAKGKLQHSPSYKKRLVQLFDHVGSGASYLLQADDLGTRDDFCERVKDYRNDIAHSNPLDDVDWSKMWYSDMILNALLRLVFLRELGWDEGGCQDAASRHNFYWVR